MSVQSNAIERLKRFLLNGNNITAGQAANKFGINNMRTAVRVLRNDGYAVYQNKTRTVNGDPITLFRLGTPTREVVAAGYRALDLI